MGLLPLPRLHGAHHSGRRRRAVRHPRGRRPHRAFGGSAGRRVRRLGGRDQARRRRGARGDLRQGGVRPIRPLRGRPLSERHAAGLRPIDPDKLGGLVETKAPQATLRGLTEDEAQRRLAERGSVEPPASSRSYASIVRANVLTVFNLILFVAGVVTLAFGEWQDALFLAILIANTGIGIGQEIRAKRALDRLAALVAPTGRVIRDGKPRLVGVDELVPGDLVELQAGDQVVADGHLERASALTVDESILTGEAEPVARRTGEDVRSGSFAVEGSGAYIVTKIGPESYAERIAGEARAFRHPRSPLERSLDRLLFVLVGVLIPLSIILGAALWERDVPLDEAVTTSVAAGVTLVPEGLILLTSITFAVAALQMAQRGALAQQLNAIESLASVDVLCLDKTGTLTELGLRVVEVVPAAGVPEEETRRALGRFAASSPAPNATLAAIQRELPADLGRADGHVPFSSRWRRRGSGASSRHSATRGATSGWWVTASTTCPR